MISVIVPCYNAAATLAATVQSALAQDVEKEVIVVDDGSTDASGEIIRSFGERIRSVATPNRGVSAARDLGTRLARGRFLQYLDSDDVLMPGTLAARRAALEEYGADIAHTDWQKLVRTEAGGYQAADVVRPNLAALAADAEAATAVSEFWAPPAAVLYRRSVVERIGGWAPNLSIVQDARFLFEAAACGAKFVHVPGVGAQYRVAPDSLSRRSTERFIEDCATNARDIEALWRSRGLLPDRRRQALAAMWWHVAHASLFGGLRPFETARKGYMAVAPRSVVLDLGLVLRTILGTRRSSALVRASALGRRTISRAIAPRT